MCRHHAGLDTNRTRIVVSSVVCDPGYWGQPEAIHNPFHPANQKKTNPEHLQLLPQIHIRANEDVDIDRQNYEIMVYFVSRQAVMECVLYEHWQIGEFVIIGYCLLN